MKIASKIAASVLVLSLAACSSSGNRYTRLLTPTANPSKVVAIELAFARAAQEDGQWTAFRDFSTGDAIMFVPEVVNAHDWLSKQSDPAEAVRWQPHQVWSSCDGSLAVTKGAWQRSDGSTGYFTTVWQRQGDGEYEWVMDQGDVLSAPLPAPEMIETVVADCTGDAPAVVISGRDGNTYNGGHANDRTLYWSTVVRADGSREIRATVWRDGAHQTVLDETVAAGG